MTTETKTYNGWTNYETWCVNLWLDNEQGSYDFWRERAQEQWDSAAPTAHWTREESAIFALEDELKAEFEEGKDSLLGNANATCSVWADLLGAALSEVNWREIAEHLVEEVDKSDDGDDSDE